MPGVPTQMVQTRGSSRSSAPPSAPSGGGRATGAASGVGEQPTGSHKAQKRRPPSAAATSKKKVKVLKAEDSKPALEPAQVAVKSADSPPAAARAVLPPVKEEPAALCRAPFEATGQLYVGAHVSGAGGLWNAVREAHDIGARSFALFLASQRTWNRKPLSEEGAVRFREAMQYGYSGDLVVPHGSYLMNLGSPEPETRSKSCALLLDELAALSEAGPATLQLSPSPAQRCGQAGFPGLCQREWFPRNSSVRRVGDRQRCLCRRPAEVSHGSTCGKISRDESVAHIARGINDALSVTSGVTVLLENMSRQGNTLGGDLRELRAIIDLVEDQDRIGVCLDTCHAHAAGYDLSTEAGFSTLMADFESVLGLNRLRAVHLNDSKSPVGSHKDRHENIGKGTIGKAGIMRVLADPRFQRLPIVLETPYVDDGIYRREIKLLYGMIGA
ncbi:putative endonuclease 4 [Amphibalanus amphitrite]|uniref:Putative endonuclease 4 n=1 Tax=Amphibalanus amphitrite TaxID=1232801 RepID=A0A6A4WDD2_AMPAM|nr:putative endonuclease 4 [Amphibalanus amphitrite]